MLQTQREFRAIVTRRRLRAVRGEAPRQDSAALDLTDPWMASIAAMLFEVTGVPLLGKPLPDVAPAAQLPSGSSRLVDSGKITLLAMVDPGCGSNCMTTYAMFRRLARQFPALDIKLVATAYGHIRQYAPAPLATQAEQIRAYYLDSLGIGNAVIVDAPTSMRLADPDRRLMYGTKTVSDLIRAPAKDEVARLGIPMTFYGWMALVDPQGIVVLQEPTGFELEGILQVLVDRLSKQK